MAPTETPLLLPLTTDPFWLEARPRLVSTEGDPAAFTFDWHRIDAPGHRLAVQVRTLDAMGWEEAQAATDTEAKIALVASRCLVSAWCDGKPLSLGSVPHLQRRVIAGLVYSLSSTGLDPFGAPPAASPR